MSKKKLITDEATQINASVSCPEQESFVVCSLSIGTFELCLISYKVVNTVRFTRRGTFSRIALDNIS